MQSGRLRMTCVAQWTAGISRATFSVRCSTVIFRRTLPVISIRAKSMQATRTSAMRICLMQRQSRHEKSWCRKKGSSSCPVSCSAMCGQKQPAMKTSTKRWKPYSGTSRNPQKAAPLRGSLQDCSMITMSTAISWAQPLPSATRSL